MTTCEQCLSEKGDYPGALTGLHTCDLGVAEIVELFNHARKQPTGRLFTREEILLVLKTIEIAGGSLKEAFTCFERF